MCVDSINPSILEEASDNILSLTDTIKYLYSVEPNNPDNLLLTPELVSAFENLAANCDEYIRVFNYYKEKKTPQDQK